MSDVTKEGMAIAPGVVETIVALAVRDVPGVASVGMSPTGLRALIAPKQATDGISVSTAEDGTLQVAVELHIIGGHSLTEIADQVRTQIADAVLSQAGMTVSRVDVRIDGIQFRD